MKRKRCGTIVAVPLINERCVWRKDVTEQLASAKGERPLAQKRKALALQVLFVVETRGLEPLTYALRTHRSTN